jgi:ATP-dependent Lon protease
VTPVGGIKEKVLGAHRAQITTVILPWANRKEIDSEVAPEIRSSMKFVFVRTVEESLEAAFGKKVLAWRYSPVLLETRL